jgi:hypothetical protein
VVLAVEGLSPTEEDGAVVLAPVTVVAGARFLRRQRPMSIQWPVVFFAINLVRWRVINAKFVRLVFNDTSPPSINYCLQGVQSSLLMKLWLRQSVLKSLDGREQMGPIQEPISKTLSKKSEHQVIRAWFAVNWWSNRTLGHGWMELGLW